MTRLAAAAGIEFDRLFLEFMIRHHDGALIMVNELSSPSRARGRSPRSLPSFLKSIPISASRWTG